jgi:uncharacterized protein involved in exopolysaccharide biosynthesis
MKFSIIEGREQSANGQQPNRLSSALQAMSGLELRTLAGIIARQWQLILAVLLLTLLLAMGLLSQMRYRYTAEALLSIDERESQLVGQEDSVAEVPASTTASIPKLKLLVHRV